MSIITMLGGAEAHDVEEKNGKLIAKLDSLEKTIISIDDALMNLKNNINAIQIESETYKTRVEELSLSLRSMTKEWKDSEERGMALRVAEIERMQKYFSSSHGRVLNDIVDLKKELHNLYNRQTPPPEEELAQSIDRNPKKLELYDMIKASDYTDYRKQKLINTLDKNNIHTMDDLKKINFDDLCDIKEIGPASAMLLINLRNKYYGEVPYQKKIREDVPNYSIKAVVKEMKIKQLLKSRIVNTLYTKYGINTLQDLKDIEIDQIENIPGFGKKTVDIVKQIYQDYIWG